MRTFDLPHTILTSLMLLGTASIGFADELEIERDLRRPSPAVDPNAKGRIELERDSDGDEKFDVDIRRIDALGQTYTLWIEDAVGSSIFVDVGSFVPDGNDEAEYERRSPNLPLGAANLAVLKDRALEVRDGSGSAILLGAIPDIANATAGGGGGNGGNGGNGDRKQKSERPLMRPASAPIPNATGKVEVEQQRGEDELEIETEHFDVVSTTYSVWIEDGSGAMQDVGDLAADRGRSDHGKIEWNTEDGQSLPLGASRIDELAGRRIEIRDPGDVVVLAGTIPSVSSSRSTTTSSQGLAPTGPGRTADAKGKVKSSWKASKGRFRLDLRAQARVAPGTVTLWIENPETGVLEQAASGSWRGGGRKNVRFRWRTDKSASLPLGVLDPSDLLGSQVEIRDEAGQVLLTGTI